MRIPELSLVVLMGASGSGKSTFAQRHFLPTEVLSSDRFRGLVADDENAQDATNDAFEALHFVAAKRLAAGRLTVIDATNTQKESRAPLVALARRCHVAPIAVVFDVPQRVCVERNVARPDRDFGPHVVRRQAATLRRSISGLWREGFREVRVLGPDDIDACVVERVPLVVRRPDLTGPFDIVGDVHGCADELRDLLSLLGYDGAGTHPEGRTAVFVGDLVDRGPKVLETLGLVESMVRAGTALAVPGNHDIKLVRALRGRKVQVAHGLDRSLAEMETLDDAGRTAVADFLEGLPGHYVLDGGRLVVAHAGIKQHMHGRDSQKVRSFCLYGETTGETDDLGLPVRIDWAREYRGRACIVYGHTPVLRPEWLNSTINVDTGCVFGGRLTALRWPERVLVSVPARQAWAESVRPLASSATSAQHEHDRVLDIEDVSGKRLVETTLAGRVTIREENAAAALEVISRFCVDPRWLVYLPPTMSPSETSLRPGLLEHPDEAFAYYRGAGVGTAVCEEKHMGSRAVAVVCRRADVAVERFGLDEPAPGVVYTRTGRPFFALPAVEREVLARLAAAIERARLWDELATDWVLLDCEVMPWSAKARDLIRTQYAAVGASATASTGAAVEVLERAAARGVPVDDLVLRARRRATAIALYREAYGRYCWDVASTDDLAIAPFHLLAGEDALHTDKDHAWHMQTLARVCAHDPLVRATPWRTVDLHDEDATAAAVAWWEDLTGRGGEGMVVKPLDFLAHGGRGVLQPALKCRGPEYLRIIYGPEYDAPEHLERLRSRGVGRKRGLAHRELALGVEGLERFVRREPLRRVHECAFGVLALESEPVDPRL